MSHCYKPGCSVCPYSFFCECDDDRKAGISCKHIHAVALYAPQGRATYKQPLPQVKPALSCEALSSADAGTEASETAVMHRGSRSVVHNVGMNRFKPYESRGIMHPPKRVVLFTDGAIAIEREETHPLGSIMRRDLSLAESPPRPLSPLPNSLSECFKRGVLDVASAAMLIYDMKKKEKFSEGSYEEFVRYVATHGIKKISYKNFESMVSKENDQYIRLEGSQLAFDVLLAKSAVIERKSLSSMQDGRNETPSLSSFSISNCTRSWVLRAEKPFVEVDLVIRSLLWTRKRGDNLYIQSTSLFRRLLKKITEPEERIKEYAVRLHRAKDHALKDLPEVVETTLLDFAEDMLGYGREELKPGVDFDRSNSRFYMNLGKTDEQREDALEGLDTERSMWRGQLLRSLQRALSDIRSRPHVG